MRFSIAVFSALIAVPAFAQPPKVVADIAPVHALLSQVMAGIATPRLLLEQGANPHSVQLRPSQARMLADADLVIWVGPELSPWLEDIVEMEAAQHIALTAHPATRLRDFGRAGEAVDEHADDADHGDDDEHADDAEGDDEGSGMAEDDHGHDAHADEADGDDGDHAHGAGDRAPEAPAHAHSGVDPHVWLSTRNARAWLDVFAETLAERDPGNGAAYRANAADAAAGIDALAAQIAGRLEAHQGAEIVTFHDSFGYFADQFGIGIAGTVRPGDASAPSAAAMNDLRDLVADHGIECAFAEPAFDPGLLDAIAGGTGLRIGTLDPTGALLPAGPGHYAATLTGVAEAIAGCLEQN